MPTHFASEAIEAKFHSLTDFRQKKKVKHKLIDIITIIICVLASGAETYPEIALYSQCKADWLVRHVIFNLLKYDKETKLSIKKKKLQAEWSHDYAMSLVFGDISGED